MVRDPTREVIGAAMKIHRRLGPGLLESAYEACLSYELQETGHRVERQKPVPLFYKDVKLDCGFRADIVVDGVLALELKCKEALHPVDQAQLLSHMRLLDVPLGLLINFHVVLLKLLINFHVVLLKNGIKWLVNNYIESEELTIKSL